MRRFRHRKKQQVVNEAIGIKRKILSSKSGKLDAGRSLLRYRVASASLRQSAAA
jgi:hypothetical protein